MPPNGVLSHFSQEGKVNVNISCVEILLLLINLCHLEALTELCLNTAINSSLKDRETISIEPYDGGS